jgi:hypothetical protein
MQAYEQGIKSSDTRMLTAPASSSATSTIRREQCGNRRSAEEMSDFVVAIGLVMVIEGLLWAAAAAGPGC